MSVISAAPIRYYSTMAANSPTPQLEIDQISVTLGGSTVVDDVSFALAEGEIGCLLGPSGCGKTTLLRTCTPALNIGAWAWSSKI